MILAAAITASARKFATMVPASIARAVDTHKKQAKINGDERRQEPEEVMVIDPAPASAILARDLLHRKTKNTTKISYNSLKPLLSPRLATAEEIFAWMPSTNIFSWTILLAACAQAQSLGDSRVLFDEMEQRNAVAWNALITSYALGRQCDRGAVLREDPLLDDRILECDAPGLRGNRTHGLRDILLTATAQGGDLLYGRSVLARIPQESVVSYTILIIACEKKDIILLEEDQFLYSPENDVASWNALIAANARHGQMRNYIDLFKRMDLKGARPDGITFVGILSAYAISGDLATGKLIHHSALEGSSLDNPVLATVLLDMYSKASDLGVATAIFVAMAQRDVTGMRSWQRVCATGDSTVQSASSG
ncbi:pentatricopeptide repeat-containing protein At2g22410, mitochondrial-like [Selaginella moellendorffii]|uniref:pentatricopeptide repeat-containing protein At2g22410, mitochondrial-like n=1 Tax=Selaginella moellendorffii TaxID=88036 RepID=UPI000D1C4AFE|nr:pentatricopeptide repeat-containing protein At2g22410, mitochondrial-like [Selaginella moellendorffii]|eukprot:XP_024539419.1 pentatricopeptide repeat-containing protein At2g22410, mitochondrial-like [Selaginella moellendorffii]